MTFKSKFGHPEFWHFKSSFRTLHIYIRPMNVNFWSFVHHLQTLVLTHPHHPLIFGPFQVEINSQAW
uniref:Uncharacterized protein n=1 Tax=Anguilla anguilla TaxID=7936 RepID=A0A0E9VHX1_ANGAN